MSDDGVTCKHMVANPSLAYDSRYVCSCGACHDEVQSWIEHRPTHSVVHNECLKCGATWTPQVVRSW